MNFKDLKAGNEIYAVDLQKVEVYCGNVTADATLPHTDPKFGIAQLVVDVTVDVNGEQKTYVLPADADSAYPTNMVVTTSRDVVLRELKAKKSTSQQNLSMKDYHEECIMKCDKYIAMYDPAFREKQENEARFAAIEQGQAKIMEMLKKLTE